MGKVIYNMEKVSSIIEVLNNKAVKIVKNGFNVKAEVFTSNDIKSYYNNL
jgi:hypothetical protein